MKDDIYKSILSSFKEYFDALLGHCESEIEKIFLSNLFKYLLTRPDRFEISFIVDFIDIKERDNKYIPTASPNISMADDVGHLTGFRYTNRISNYRYDVFPQKVIRLPNPDNFLKKISYRLDFGIYKYTLTEPCELIKKYCIECDGFEYHNKIEDIKRDNQRSRDILFINGFTTIRFLGTEIYHHRDEDIGKIVMGL